MPKFLFFLLFSFFIFSGCTALKFGDSFEEGSYDTEEASEEFADSEEEEYEEEDYEDEGYEYEDEEDEGYAEEEDEGYAEEEGGDEYADEGDIEDEEEEKGGIGGFFSRLFGGSDEEEDDYEDEYEDEEEFGEEGEDEYAGEDTMEDDSYSESSEDVGMEDISSQADASMSAESPSVAEKSASTTTESEKSFIPLNKIISVPYKKSDYLVNAVYIARENDTLQTVSQKIYGSDKTSDLYVINPHLQSRSVKVGDKIYYNSPLRPDDSSRLLFYYEDINAPSSFHLLSPGDNIRSVSSQLLGHPNSWKEIWATNPELESKGEISRSINIVYWPKQTVAQAAPAPEPPAPEPSIEPSPSDKMPMGDLQDGGISQPEAQMDKQAEFPDPPPIPKKSQPGLLQIILEQKEIALGLLAVIVMLILMIRLILKKRKQRDFDYTATNIEV